MNGQARGARHKARGTDEVTFTLPDDAFPPARVKTPMLDPLMERIVYRATVISCALSLMWFAIGVLIGAVIWR